MNRAFLPARLGVLSLCLLAASACVTDDTDTSATSGPATTVPEATVTSPARIPGAPVTGAPTVPGEEVERQANTAVRRVTWEDGTTVEETIPKLVFRTAANPGDGYGYRVVAEWLGSGRWLVSIEMQISRRSTTPPSLFTVRADLYYHEESGEMTAANGRAKFALTGKNPCSTAEIESGTCRLDDPAQP
ncbi:MAG: hypothetical protein Q8P22_10890 [Chloroflexota bacterium]|nr:hypothetical protein [Chloroflexota bacterium]